MPTSSNEAMSTRDYPGETVCYASEAPKTETPPSIRRRRTRDRSGDRSQGAFRQPTRIGRYVVLEVIGVGGMGVVCTAYDHKLDRKVALKLIRERGTKRRIAHGRARLIREAQALAKLSHPNIITVHDVDTFEGKLYMAMEYVEGHTLSEWLRRERRSWREILEMFAHAGRGVAAAHAAGIVHRDFKPSNVLIGDDGRVRVLDFGLAKTNEAESSFENLEPHDLEDTSTHTDLLELLGTATGKLTQAGRIVGTPAYMAPEQHLGGDITPASDQFSFAVALYESVYGYLPFGSDGERESFWRAAQSIVRPPPRDTEVPPWVHQILKRALRARIEERYPSMNDLLAALAADPEAVRRKKMRTAAAIVSAMVGIGGTAAGVLAMSRANRCDGAEERLADIWNERRRGEVEQALLGTAVPYAASTISRVQGTLDDYATRWSANFENVCLATVRGEQSSVLLDLRMGCLDRQRAELRALVELLEQPSEALVEQAVNAVHALGDPLACADYEAGADDALPSDEGLRARIESVREELARVKALMDAARYGEAQTLAASAKAAAFALPHRATQIEAALAEAEAAKEAGNWARAEDGYRQVILSAAEHGAARTEAEALGGLLFLLGVKRQRTEEALALRLALDAALGRARRPADLELELSLSVGAVLVSGNRLDEALEQQEAVLRLAQEQHERPHPTVATAHDQLNVTLTKLGQYDRALGHAAQALSLTREVYGEDHPRTAARELHHGHALLKLGRLREAEAAYEHARGIRRRVFGPFDARVAEVQLAFAYLYLRREDHARARDVADNAVDILRAIADGDRGPLVPALNTAGDVALRMNDIDRALSLYREALALVERQPEADRLMVGRMHLRLCATLEKTDRAADGLAHCERALAFFDDVYDTPHATKTTARRTLAGIFRKLDRLEPSEQQLRVALSETQIEGGNANEAAAIQLSLAEVLIAQGGRRDEARDLVRQAETALGPTPDTRNAEQLAELRSKL